jgi:hypothetical protein
MALITGTFEAARSHFRLFGGLLAVTALAVAPAAYGQDRDRDYDRGRDYDRPTKEITASTRARSIRMFAARTAGS